MWSVIIDTFPNFFIHPIMLIVILGGVLWGIIWGSIPGLSTTMSLALLVPLTFGYDANISIVFLIAAYTAGVYGGCLSAILMNIPGTPSAIATTFDGHKMAQKNQAGQAIWYATTSSFIGGMIGCFILVSATPILAKIALTFSNQEYVAIALFGVCILAYISPGSTFKGVISGILGLLLGTVGMDLITGVPRFDFGTVELLGGVSIEASAIGLFGISEIIDQVEKYEVSYKVKQEIEKVLLKAKDILTHYKLIIKSSIIGTVVGVIPAAGDCISTMVAYAQGKASSKHPERWGTGIPEGVIAPESANNAGVGGALIPMLTLGIPGDSMTAILIGGLMIHGIRPGPMLFVNNLPLVATIFISLFLGIIFTTIIGLVSVKKIVIFLTIPRYFLLPIIVIICIIGSYASGNSFFNVRIMIIFGVIGYLMKKLDIPISPIVLGMVIGPLLEDNFRRSLMITQGDLFTFFKRPISLILIILVIIFLFFPFFKKVSQKIYNSVQKK
ncbi:unnamed protein product [marine sediment metagenome]|uniref:DUF112 domain-containing protein n=1 Tax=marine sediment metagenome TaxID=412755 RepID=X0ZRM4_9ZZZZ